MVAVTAIRKAGLTLGAVAAAAAMVLGVAGTRGGAEAAHANGAVYVLSNQAAANSVLVYERNSDGSLDPAGSVPTGGLGTGSGLGSQGSIVLSDSGRYLFAVNAGSDDITSFEVTSHGLEAVDRIASGGIRPTSITEEDGLVYVLNAGGTGNITGFTVDHGDLEMIPGSTRPLSGGATNPAQVQFSPDGRVLVVSERATNQLSTYTVGRHGRATGPQVFASSGSVPFGFDFAGRNKLVVSEAAPGAASSYRLSRDGDLDLVDGTVVNGNAAACWLVVSKNGHFAYTTNAASATISGYRIAWNGDLSLLDADGVTATTSAQPLDMDISGNGRFLYAVTGNGHAVNAFRIGADGSLTAVDTDGGLPAGAVGIAAQ